MATANAKMIWNRAKSPTVVASGNRVAAGVNDFHGLLGIESEHRSWDARRLESVAEFASQTIQKSKNAAPFVLAAGGLAAAAVVGKNIQGDGKAGRA